MPFGDRTEPHYLVAVLMPKEDVRRLQCLSAIGLNLTLAEIERLLMGKTVSNAFRRSD